MDIKKAKKLLEKIEYDIKMFNHEVSHLTDFVNDGVLKKGSLWTIVDGESEYHEEHGRWVKITDVVYDLKEKQTFFYVQISPEGDLSKSPKFFIEPQKISLKEMKKMGLI